MTGLDEVQALGGAGLALLAVVVCAGALLQRLAGQGFGMISAPMVAIVAPEFLPATLLLLGAVVGLTSTAVDLSAVDRRELPPGFAGRALGAALAAWIALHLSETGTLSILVALIVYAGIALSLVGIRVRIGPLSLFVAGTAAGLMGTLTAVGAPPKALLYQHEPRRRSAAMQNVFFAWGMGASITALALAGLISARHLLLAVILAPAVLLGVAASQPLARRVEKARIRPWALGLAGAAATVLLLRQLA